MRLEIFYDKQPEKFLQKIDKLQARRIIEKVDLLTLKPVPQGAIPIVGEQGVFRLRVGNLRILYRINYRERKIIILKVGKRESVYTH